MRALVSWDPIFGTRGMRRLIDRVFDDTFFRPYRVTPWAFREDYLPLDVYQNEGELVVKASLPGVKPEDVEVTLDHSTLVIKGEMKDSREGDHEGYMLRERRLGVFHRRIALSKNLKTDEIDATFENGILTISIPRAKEAKPKVIEVKPAHHIEDEKAE